MIFSIFFRVAVALFLIGIWGIDFTKIGFVRWVVGWVVGMELIGNFDKIQRYFLRKSRNSSVGRIQNRWDLWARSRGTL